MTVSQRDPNEPIYDLEMDEAKAVEFFRLISDLEVAKTEVMMSLRLVREDTLH